MSAGATGSTAAGRFPVLLSGCCLGGGNRCGLLLLVLLLGLGLLCLLLLLLCLLGLPFAFFLCQFAVAFLAFAGQFRIRRRFELEIRSAAGVVITAVAATNEYRRLRSMALGIIRFGLGTRSAVHVVHGRRWFRVGINVQRFDMYRFVRMRMVTRLVAVMPWRWTMSRMVAGMARWRSQHADTAGSGVSMRSQGIHVAGFATDLQLVLDEGIVRSGRVR